MSLPKDSLVTTQGTKGAARISGLKPEYLAAIVEALGGWYQKGSDPVITLLSTKERAAGGRLVTHAPVNPLSANALAKVMAAIKSVERIQAAYRGFATRTSLLVSGAAVSIQAAYRGSLQRRRDASTSPSSRSSLSEPGDFSLFDFESTYGYGNRPGGSVLMSSTSMASSTEQAPQRVAPSPTPPSTEMPGLVDPMIEEMLAFLNQLDLRRPGSITAQIVRPYETGRLLPTPPADLREEAVLKEIHLGAVVRGKIESDKIRDIALGLPLGTLELRTPLGRRNLQRKLKGGAAAAAAALLPVFRKTVGRGRR